MMPVAKLVSPPPPPTSNTLTHSQRARLMRTTKKLSQVLGSTPQMLESVTARPSTPVCEDWSDDEEEWYRPASRSSTRSNSGSSSTGSTTSSLISRSITRSRRSSVSEESRRSTKPPLLRLALSSFSQRSSSAASKHFPSPTSSNSSDDEDGRFTLHTTTNEAPRDSMVSPNFRIPSSTTIRLQKMDRIRKKLGEGVPVNLVFPGADSDEEEEERKSTSSQSRTIIQVSTAPPLPPTPSAPRPRSRSAKSSHAGARDSIVSTSAHRGQRVKRKPVPRLEIVECALPSPPTPSSKRSQARLSLILETPQDLELLVIASGSSSSSSPTSQWFSEDESEQWVNYKTYTRMVQDS